MGFFFFFFNQQYFYVTVLAIIMTILVLSTIFYTNNKHKNKKSPPQAPGSWPIIGHLHLLTGSNNLLHRTLASMADNYGPAFSVRLGIHRALVVSDREVARDCFTKNDKVFSTRPRSLAVKLMGYDHAMFGMAPYGPYWRRVRKLATVELLSSHRLESLRYVRDTEVDHFMRELYNDRDIGLVEMKERFGDLATNITVRMVAGKRYSGDDEESRLCQRAMAKFFRFWGMFMVSDSVPWLGWLDSARGYVGEMKKTARELDCVLSSWVEEHRRKRRSGRVGVVEQDFIHVMLSIMEDDGDDVDGGRMSGHDTDTVVKGTCLVS